MKRKVVMINDLFGFVYPKRAEYITAEDNIHLSAAGIDAVAKQVSDIIRKNA